VESMTNDQYKKIADDLIACRPMAKWELINPDLAKFIRCVNEGNFADCEALIANGSKDLKYLAKMSGSWQ
jgi:hypothetical protein